MTDEGLHPADTPRFCPRLTLHTLGRGDGLLGLKPAGPFGPRGPRVTVAQIDWVYRGEGGRRFEMPAPISVLNSRAPAVQTVEDTEGRSWRLRRDRAAEADALDAVWAAGLHPLPGDALQWRAHDLPRPSGPLWTLVQEDFFGDFWAERVPPWQAQGWVIVVRPGFAHETLLVDAWRLVIDPASGEVLGKELAAPLLRPHEVAALRLPEREGSWMLSLGVEINGETWDLVPLLADLLKRDSRWLDARKIAAIADHALIRLHAPGGRRIDAPAAPLKAIVGAMVDLLTDPRRAAGPIALSSWEAQRLDVLRLSLMDTQARRAGPQGAWQLQGEAGLRSLAQRLQGV
ncbi:MAG: ATP-dependent helicase, partial [Cytophagales bacterium]|nr:ATP-dependent helicase [Rhizobacter sp.]